MPIWLPAVVLTVLMQASAATQEVDPALQALAEKFFATQQAEDADGYLALWSSTARKPTRDQLKFIFDSGDDRFNEVTVSRATVTGETARVRVSAMRVRTDVRFKNPDGTPRELNSRVQLALALVREAGEWRILREGAPTDELAAGLIAAADVESRKLLMAAEPDLLTPRLVDAISRQADGLVQSGQYRAAQTLYERGLEVARAIGNKRAEGQALHNIANSLYFQQQFAAAQQAYEARLGLAREATDDEGAAAALVGIGTVLYSTYEYGRALTAYRDALAIQERLNDPNMIGTTLISTGNVLYLQGDYAAAIADYRRAEELKRSSHDLPGAASALEGLGRVYSSQGDFAAALTAFDGVLAERRRSNDGPRQALVLHSIAEIHFRLGNTDAARAGFQESRQVFEKVKDLASAGRALQGAALTELVVGRFAAAEKAYTESITGCTTATDPECVARAQVGLAYALAAQEKFDDAVTWYGRSLISFNELKLEEAGARARLGLAEALFGRGDHEKAIEQTVTARRTAIALNKDDVLWRALVATARAERKLGRSAAALGSARAAVQTVQRMASAALERPGQAAPADSTTAYSALAVLQAEQGDAAGAFNSIEALRAHNLRIALAGSEREIARGMTEEERAEERRVTTALTTLLAQRDSERQLPRPDSARLVKLQTAIEEATAVRAAAQQKLFTRLPELRIWRGLAGGATVDDLPALLDSDGKVLLQLLVDDHDVLVLTAARKPDVAEVNVMAVARPVKRQQLAERIAEALGDTSLRSVETWRRASKPLFELFPAEVVEQLSGATSVVVIPDDTFWRIPFEAMPIRDRYLADHASVIYSTSVAAAVKLPPAAAEAMSNPRIVAVVAPALSQTTVEQLKATAPTWTLRAPELASAEAAAIKVKDEAQKPVVLSGTDATKAALISAAGSAGAIHIAAPFRVNTASPLFSPIVLSEGVATPSPEAGASAKSHATQVTQLDGRDIFNLSSSARVVVLSDPSALSMRDAARGIAPIGWAWRASGAATLMIRRWGGGEGMSNQMLGSFYEQLASGEAPSRAFEAARTAVRNTEAGRAPAAWAGWLVLSGR